MSSCDEAIQGPRDAAPGLLHCARNDGWGVGSSISGRRLSNRDAGSSGARWALSPPQILSVGFWEDSAMTPRWIEPELCKLVTRIPAGDNWVAAAPLTIRACMRKPSNLISCAADAQRARLNGEVSGRSPPPSARSTAGRPIRAMLFPAAERWHNSHTEEAMNNLSAICLGACLPGHSAAKPVAACVASARGGTSRSRSRVTL